MNAYTKYIRYTWFVLGMVFLVILAGGVVRMTQSGMGCPDWPKCFGRWIPPVNESQLPADFEKYLDRQDIDHSFNAYHTWIEYINRLLGAVLGLLTLLHVIWSFKTFRHTKPSVVSFSFLMLAAVAFQGWLGKMVVDANLHVVKVTLHMTVAMLITLFPLIIISRIVPEKIPAGKKIKIMAGIAIFTVLLQIVLGTQVREQIDEISKSLNYTQRDLWINSLDNIFIIHRSFSWLVALSVFVLLWQSQIYPGLKKHRLFIFSIFLLTAIAGLTMYFINIPAWAQPLHLLCASLLFTGICSFMLRLK
jgi:cytochrome c oxidase assembly protein subunit 15